MNQQNIFEIILSAHVSEKAATAADKRNEYAFYVAPFATKPAIKDAVESLFGKKVKGVRIVNVKPKTRTFKGIEGTKKGWKKAYVTLQSGEKLDIFGVQ
jgi:large subunit ribosomal protein L23